MAECALLLGSVKTLDESLGRYRLHGRSASAGRRRFGPTEIREAVDNVLDRMEHMERVAASLDLDGSAASWRARNWRLQTLEHLLARDGSNAPGPSLREHLASVIRSQKDPLRRSALLAFVLGVRSAPLSASIRLARRMIRLEYM